MWIWINMECLLGRGLEWPGGEVGPGPPALNVPLGKAPLQQVPQQARPVDGHPLGLQEPDRLAQAEGQLRLVGVEEDLYAPVQPLAVGVIACPAEGRAQVT